MGGLSKRAAKSPSAATKRESLTCGSGKNFRSKCAGPGGKCSEEKDFRELKFESIGSCGMKREAFMSDISSVWVIAGLCVLAVILVMALMARMYRKAGPHEALIVYGFRGTRIIKGGGTIIFPMEIG